MGCGNVKRSPRGAVGPGWIRLSRSVLIAVAKVDSPDKVDANSVAAVLRKLKGTLRGVARLRAAIAIVGQARYLELCKELNFASDHDIPDREALRKAVESLDAEAVRKTANVSRRSTANGATGSSSAQASNPPTAKGLGETRLVLIRDAHRVARLRKIKVAEVVDRAAKGAFTYQQIKQLTVRDIAAMKVATDVLRKSQAKKEVPRASMAQGRQVYGCFICRKSASISSTFCSIRSSRATIAALSSSTVDLAL